MFIEEPVLSENREALKEIAALGSTPIALGERLYSGWDFKSVFEEAVSAGSVARRRHHQMPQDRGDGRSL